MVPGFIHSYTWRKCLMMAKEPMEQKEETQGAITDADNIYTPSGGKIDSQGSGNGAQLSFSDGQQTRDQSRDVGEINTDRINIAETVGGNSTRKYLNTHITPALLKGMRLVALETPEDPLRFLGEYLIAESDRRDNNTAYSREAAAETKIGGIDKGNIN
ncbi:Sdc1p Ecym_4526 [Eremothecium cymbalariae DBVPG|uniref:Uncharacterized protein n=1 Tax=Eremothecium cymbalariae (strain CBS 270.75 / DBVPG 7215 / KCTC 17166 / NRRL Y-17582) TaxID=931890 RepID=G8JU60_ERECY|nr:hypothetical protein Ecym_4526 [Eremothecium cymbalariae DBVPG\